MDTLITPFSRALTLINMHHDTTTFKKCTKKLSC
jgi:hypothetical protein